MRGELLLERSHGRLKGLSVGGEGGDQSLSAIKLFL